MDTKDPLIDATVKVLSEAPSFNDRLEFERIIKLRQLWAMGGEEQCTKLAYEWVKTGVLSYQAFHLFIHELVA